MHKFSFRLKKKEELVKYYWFIYVGAVKCSGCIIYRNLRLLVNWVKSKGIFPKTSELLHCVILFLNFGFSYIIIKNVAIL